MDPSSLGLPARQSIGCRQRRCRERYRRQNRKPVGTVVAAMYGVDVAELAVKISEAALYPNLGLTAAYAQNYQTIPQELRTTNVSILGQLPSRFIKAGH